jgi:hypothetical protein
MLVRFKWIALGLALVTLSGCLEVDDKSDSKVVDSLEQQNQLLEQQLKQAQQQAEQQKVSVTLGGVITNLSTGNKVSNTTVTVKVGASTPVVATVTDGSFQVTQLPANSDYELVIHSAANEFMDRTYFGRTRATSAAGALYQDLGKLEVAAATEYSFAVFDTKTGEPIDTLIFWANSNSGEGATEESFWHRASYDASTGRYKITVPQHIATLIQARLDLDNDGVNDYQPPFSDSVSYLQFFASYLNAADNFFLNDIRVGADQGDSENIQLRIAVVGANASFIPDLTLSLRDGINGAVSSSFDSASNQYVINAVLKNHVQVMLPSFSYLGQQHNSVSVDLERIDASKYSVSINGSYAEVSFDEAAERVFNLTLTPSVINVYSNLRVVSKTTAIANNDPAFNVFYSSPISPLSNSEFTLLRKNIVRIVRGNESATDVVLAGTTQIDVVDEPVTVTTSLTQGNTFLRVEPVGGLLAGSDYQYNIGSVIDEVTGASVDVSGDYINFTLPEAPAAFDINSLRLDNNNYFTGGAIIKAQNTAGQTSFAVNWNGSIYLYLPKSIVTLKSLTLRKVAVTNEGTSSARNDTYALVSNGSFSFSNVYAYSMAENEYVMGSLGYQVHRGTAMADGKYYSLHINEYLPDSIIGSESSVKFTYSYETLAGEIGTGEFTLQIQ